MEPLRDLERALRAPAPAEQVPHAEALEWLALVPLWPAEVARQGFWAGTELVRDAHALSMLDELEDGGWVDSMDAPPPWSGKVYRMSRPQRRRALQLAQRRFTGSSGSLLESAFKASNLARQAQDRFSAPYPQVLRLWCELLAPSSGRSMPEAALIADRLRQAVQHALRGARALELEGSPEAAALLDAAEPLAAAVGGHLRVAVAACQRQLELYHRRVQDERGLDNYQDRDELNQAAHELVSGDQGWALHYIGVGGVGKTMFLRHLQTRLAAQWGLATARVDFDHLNPDYPLRSPGLLLLSFAEELRLEAPEAAIDYFRKLALEVSHVHAALEAARREGRDIALGFGAPGFDFCMTVFVEALGAIERAGRRPLLILDTCEELARLRFDGRLPQALVETFKIVEDLHRRLPALRVVFSGRRPLARQGLGWTWASEELPERDYLLLCPILGFDADEALGMLRNYRLKEDGQERAVPAELHAGMLELSKSPQAQELARLSIASPVPGARSAGRPRSAGPAEEDRYSPYDVALYAGWAAADATLTADKLRRAGHHHYVRERIVARLQEDVRAWLPSLTVLGTFDEELLRDLTGLGDDAAGLWAEIRQQEWTDLDHGVSTLADQAPLSFWHVDPQLRARLRSYYVDETPGAWANARHQVAEVLGRSTLAREWPRLSQAYFEVSADVLSDRPLAAVEWWRQVEHKILASGAWEWADQISATLLGPGGPVPSGRAAGSTTHPLSGPLEALRANVQMRSFVEDDSLAALWSEVSHSLASYPQERGRELLELRAAVGQVAYLRYRSHPLAADHAHEFQGAFERIPPFEPLASRSTGQADAALARQAMHTELALLDNAVEVMERVEWNGRPRTELIDLVLRRAAGFAQQLGSERWLGPYVQRLKLLAGSLDHDWSWQAEWQSPTPDVLKAPAFDWVPPKDLQTRRLLECGRLIEAGGRAPQLDEFCDTARARVPRPGSLDEDRLLSQALRLDGVLPAGVAADWIQASLRACLQHEECQAHRKVPPLFVTVIQALAAAGGIDAALEALQAARAGRPGTTSVRWLDAVAAHLNRRFRLAEVASDAPSVPELPPSAASAAVSDFLAATAANLARAKQRQLGPGDLSRARALAQSLCSRQGFPLPARMDDLSAVPEGWRPWFARFLVAQTLAPPRVDEAERAALASFLTRLYGTDLLEDVAFLESERVPAVSRQPWLVRSIGGMVFAASLWGAVKGVGLGAAWAFGRDLPWWQDALLLPALALTAGLVATLVPALLRSGVRLLGSLVCVRSTVGASADGSHYVDSRIEPWIVEAVMRSRPVRRAGRVEAITPYLESASAFGRPSATKALESSFLPRWMLGPMGQARIRHDIVLTGNEAQLAPVCWEAVFGTWNPGATDFSHCPFEFLRTGQRTWVAATPLSAGVKMLSVSALRELSAWRAVLEGHRSITALGARGLPDESDRLVGALLLQAEVSLTDTGVRLALESSSSRTFRPEDLARLFPNLRLVVLLGLDRSEAVPRTPTDRLVAANARTAAYELFRVAAPAVICIPGLPSRTSLADEVVQLVAAAVARQPGNALAPLRSAVRRIQDRIFAGAGLEAQDATELAYDVCFYCADAVSLKVGPRLVDEHDANERRPKRHERGVRA